MKIFQLLPNGQINTHYNMCLQEDGTGEEPLAFCDSGGTINMQGKWPEKLQRYWFINAEHWLDEPKAVLTGLHRGEPILSENAIVRRAGKKAFYNIGNITFLTRVDRVYAVLGAQTQ